MKSEHRPDAKGSREPGGIHRWLACFFDPVLENAFRESRLSDQKKGGVAMLLVLAVVSVLSLFNDLSHYQGDNGGILQILLNRISATVICGGAAVYLYRAKSHNIINNIMIILGVYVVSVTIYTIAYHPGLGMMAPTTAVGAVALIYFFAPFQFPGIVLLAAVMSVGGWVGWAILRGHQASADTFRLFLWLAIVNVVGFLGSKAFHRTLRELFWEQRQLEQQKALAERAYEHEHIALEQFKHFAELISHEFRNPLAIVKGKAQLLQLISTVEGAEDPEALPAIERAANRLDSLFSQWLASDRLADGDIPFVTEMVSLEILLRRVEREAPYTTKHSIAFDAVPPDLVVQGDPILLRMALLNLIDNAVKYSPDGSDIRVSASRPGGALVIEVQDHGIGISPEHCSSVFEKYFRASNDGGTHGLGIGLFFVRRIMEMHGGSVDLESKLGEGTTVSLRMPG